MFIMVEASMTKFSMVDVSLLLVDDRLVPALTLLLSDESDMYSRHRPRRNPLRAGTASAGTDA